MKRETHVIVVETQNEDYKVTVRQSGKRITIRAEREGVASSVLRSVVETLTKGGQGKDDVKAIGFRMDDSPSGA